MGRVDIQRYEGPGDTGSCRPLKDFAFYQEGNESKDLIELQFSKWSFFLLSTDCSRVREGTRRSESLIGGVDQCGSGVEVVRAAQIWIGGSSSSLAAFFLLSSLSRLCFLFS